MNDTPKPIHRAKMIGPDGAVSALCFRGPRVIDLKRATWTNRNEAVTCKRCLTAIAAAKAKHAIAGS